MTPAKQRIAEYRARQKARGLKEVAVFLTPEALEALRLLLDTSPTATMSDVISAALVDTAARKQPKAPPPPVPVPAAPVMLNTTEAARRLQVTVPELTRWRKEGRGPRAVRVKDRWLYEERDIDAWIKEGIRIAEEFAR